MQYPLEIPPCTQHDMFKPPLVDNRFRNLAGSKQLISLIRITQIDLFSIPSYNSTPKIDILKICQQVTNVIKPGRCSVHEEIPESLPLQSRSDRGNDCWCFVEGPSSTENLLVFVLGKDLYSTTECITKLSLPSWQVFSCRLNQFGATCSSCVSIPLIFLLLPLHLVFFYLDIGGAS